MPTFATRGTVVPRFLFLILLSLTVAACGMRQSGETAAVDEPLDLVLRPAPDKPESSGPRRPVSADVVRKTDAEARALFGSPVTLRREPPGEVWQYLAESPRCSLLLFLYPDEDGSRAGRLRVTHAQVLSRVRGQTVDDSECLAALLKTPIPTVEPAPPTPTS
ncbi:hypothetical protein [uncultured Ferrovibrio sp.]|uniref:hypothetical protein n=1 Tax=uncultured Ferrovibrio sp. TaxID=1576913 RepID=UPI00262CB1F1|nr:hypothetical protein [uncultured Ferrovibrio sp.]